MRTEMCFKFSWLYYNIYNIYIIFCHSYTNYKAITLSKSKKNWSTHVNIIIFDFFFFAQNTVTYT